MEKVYTLISGGPQVCLDRGHHQFCEVFGHGDQTWFLVMDTKSAAAAFQLPLGKKLFGRMVDQAMRMLGLVWEVPHAIGQPIKVELVQAVWFSTTAEAACAHTRPLSPESALLWLPEFNRIATEMFLRALAKGAAVSSQQVQMAIHLANAGPFQMAHLAAEESSDDCPPPTEADESIQDIGECRLPALPVDRTPTWEECERFAKVVLAGPTNEVVADSLRQGKTPVVEILLVNPMRNTVSVDVVDLVARPDYIELFMEDVGGPANFIALIVEPADFKDPEGDLRMLWYASLNAETPPTIQ